MYSFILGRTSTYEKRRDEFIKNGGNELWFVKRELEAIKEEAKKISDNFPKYVYDSLNSHLSEGFSGDHEAVSPNDFRKIMIELREKFGF